MQHCMALTDFKHARWTTSTYCRRQFLACATAPLILFTTHQLLPQMLGMIPGFNSSAMPQGNDKQQQLTIKRYITIIESMTEKELDTTNIKMLSEQSRVMRLARGSGEQAWHRLWTGKHEALCVAAVCRCLHQLHAAVVLVDQFPSCFSQHEGC